MSRAKNKKLSGDQLIEAIELESKRTVLDALSNYYMDSDDAMELIGEFLDPAIEEILKKEIKPRLKTMAKDKKLMDKLAKDILVKKIGNLR